MLPKQLRTHRPESPEEQNKTAVCRAGTAGQQASTTNNTRALQNHIPRPAPDAENPRVGDPSDSDGQKSFKLGHKDQFFKFTNIYICMCQTLSQSKKEG